MSKKSQKLPGLTKGAAGLSALDAKQCKHILCSKQLNKEGKDL